MTQPLTPSEGIALLGNTLTTRDTEERPIVDQHGRKDNAITLDMSAAQIVYTAVFAPNPTVVENIGKIAKRGGMTLSPGKAIKQARQDPNALLNLRNHVRDGLQAAFEEAFGAS